MSTTTSIQGIEGQTTSISQINYASYNEPAFLSQQMGTAGMSLACTSFCSCTSCFLTHMTPCGLMRRRVQRYCSDLCYRYVASGLVPFVLGVLLRLQQSLPPETISHGASLWRMDHPLKVQDLIADYLSVVAVQDSFGRVVFSNHDPGLDSEQATEVQR